MLSGIAGLKCKWVKNSSQRSWSLFIGAQKNSQLGIQFEQKWLRKRPYALCKNNRGLGDLQLCHSLLGPLLFKILEKNSFKQGQTEFKSGQPRPRARRQA
jgi:hypothetical protein